MSELFDRVAQRALVERSGQSQDGIAHARPLRAPINAPSERRLILRQLAEVEPEEIDWLWDGRLPCGKVTLLVGDPGAGKSYASLAIAAAITLGRPLPGDDRDRAPRSVIVWNGEDGVADTIRPRADLCGADVGRIYVIESDTDERGEAVPFGLASLRRLSDEIERRGDVAVVVIDPLAALLGGVDAHRDNEIRVALSPLKELAERHRIAVVAVLHLRKSEAARALYRVGGSIGFVGLARSVLLIAKDEQSGRRAIVPLKQNLAGEATPIEFRIDECGQFWWDGEAPDLSADRLLSAPLASEEKSAVETAEDEIIAALTDGSLLATDLERTVISRGVKPRTFERARGRLNQRAEISREGGGKGGAVRWRLNPFSANRTPERQAQDLAENAL